MFDNSIPPSASSPIPIDTGQHLNGQPHTNGQVTAPECKMIPLDRLHCNPQVRTTFDQEEIKKLAESIKTAGKIKIPLLVRRDDTKEERYTVIDGERRFRAAPLADQTEVPCNIEDKPDTDDTISQLIANEAREDLTIQERGLAYRELIKKGWKQKDIAKALGKDPSHVSNAIKTLDLCYEVQKLVDEKKIVDPSAILELARIKDVKQQIKEAREYVAGKFQTVKDINKGAKKPRKKKSKWSSPKASDTLPSNSQPAPAPPTAPEKVPLGEIVEEEADEPPPRNTSTLIVMNGTFMVVVGRVDEKPFTTIETLQALDEATALTRGE